MNEHLNVEYIGDMTNRLWRNGRWQTIASHMALAGPVFI